MIVPTYRFLPNDTQSQDIVVDCWCSVRQVRVMEVGMAAEYGAANGAAMDKDGKSPKVSQTQ